MKEVTIKISENISKEDFAEIIDAICQNGIGRSCFQDYAKLSEVLGVFGQIKNALKSFTDLKVGKIFYSGGGIYYMYRGYSGTGDILEFSEIEFDEHGNAFPSGEIVRFTPREAHDHLIAVEGY